MGNETMEIGTITARTCPTCGHHEIGYVTEDGTFHPLAPGDRVVVASGEKIQTPTPLPQPTLTEPPAQNDAAEEQQQTVPWVPEPLRGDLSLRLKYGVMVVPQMIANGMTPELYEVAYRYKLMQLIEKEVFAPMPVILDQFFTASHLGGGDAREVMEALMTEIDDVSRPVELVQQWLEKNDDESLKALISPKTMPELDESPCSDDQIAQELSSLTVEDFFEML